jgi:hypothetical protein
MSQNKGVTWWTHSIGNQDTIFYSNHIIYFTMSKRLRYHWIALVSKADLSGEMCACRLSIRSFDEAAPNGTGLRA